MTWDRVEAFQKYWVDNPPTHRMVQWLARYYGWEPAKPASIEELAAMFPQGVVK